MKKEGQLPRWAPRVKAYKIRRLYESDAQGRLDPDLLDEVGWALYSRCDSFIKANATRDGRAWCPSCQAEISFTRGPGCVICCSNCGWACSLRAYQATIKNQQLDGGPEVVGLFRQYLEAFQKAKEPAEKMLAIDQLIHGFHHFLSSGRTRRPVGINLIDGHLEFVVRFLDQLSVGPGSTAGVRENAEVWREKVRGKKLSKG